METIFTEFDYYNILNHPGIINLPNDYNDPNIPDINDQTYYIRKDGLFLGFYKAETQTYEMCNEAVQQNGLALQYVKPEFMTDEICKLAVNKNGDALCYVNPELMNDELCNLSFFK